MTPEERQQFEALQNEVRLLKNSENTNANELIIDTLIQRATGVVDANVNVSTSIGVDGVTVDAFDYPDFFLQFKYKGKLYRVPAYNEQRFV